MLKEIDSYEFPLLACVCVYIYKTIVMIYADERSGAIILFLWYLFVSSIFIKNMRIVVAGWRYGTVMQMSDDVLH